MVHHSQNVNMWTPFCIMFFCHLFLDCNLSYYVKSIVFFNVYDLLTEGMAIQDISSTLLET